MQIHRMHHEVTTAFGARHGRQHLGVEKTDQTPGACKTQHTFETVHLQVFEIERVGFDDRLNAADFRVLAKVAVGINEQR